MDYMGGDKMIALIIALVLLAVLVAGSIESNLMEVFSDPEWMDVNEWEYRL